MNTSKSDWPFRDHVRYFVTPALLNKEKNQEYNRYYQYTPDKEAEQIVMMEIKDHPVVLKILDYKLMLDSLNALENRAKGLAIILPGRDVWPFYVLMQKRKVWNDRIHFFPWMSRHAISNPTVVRKLMEEENITIKYLINHCFLFDTGFAGSIFNGIKRAYDLTDYTLKSGMVSSDSWRNQNCILQKNIYRSMVLRIEEGYPKYFTSGNSIGVQYLNSRKEILRTARLTYDLWHGTGKGEYY